MTALCLFALSALLVPTIAAASDMPEVSIAYSARIVGDTDRTRLVVDFDGRVDHKISLLSEPPRVVIDLSETIFNLNDDVLSAEKSLIDSFRFGRISQGASRMVLRLKGPALVESSELKSLATKGRHRFIVDVVSATPEEFAAKAVVETKPLLVSAQPEAAPEDRSQRVYKIMLDPGHGGIDGGAGGRYGVLEKDITLSFAKMLKSKFADDKSFEILMTRENDRFLSLQKRLERIRSAKADLLISIHADSLRQRDIRGATVYTLSEDASDAVSRSLAYEQNRTDLIAGLGLPKLEKGVSQILIDMLRRETDLFARRFARALISRMKESLRLIRNPHRSANFFVLKAPEVPSILLELGYLSNSDDSKMLRSSEWQKRAADTVHDAIIVFFDTRTVKK